LKLDNIVFSKIGGGGVLKLIDFGYSHIVDPSTDRMYRSAFGTLHYVPPEITRAPKCGRSASELKKSDLWAVGVCTYVLLTRHIPFDGNTTKEVLRSINRRKTEGLRFPQKCFLKKESIDFVERLLCIDVEARLSAKEAMKHPFISGGAQCNKMSIPLFVIKETDSNSNSDEMDTEWKDNLPESLSVPLTDRNSLLDSSRSDVDTELFSCFDD